MPRKQAGFTLVEIAIVLVIIGLLLGGVLKGQELINQAKIKNLANDLNGLSAAVYAYQDRYKAYPGDDPKGCCGTGTRWATATAGVTPTSGQVFGNGQVEGVFNSATAGDETQLFWQELRLTGLISGDTTQGTPPQNAAGGVLGVQMNAGVVAGKPALSGLVACTSNIPGKLAEALDNQLDDGNPAGGTVKGFTQANNVGAGSTQPTTGAPATSYVDDGVAAYTVCKSL